MDLNLKNEYEKSLLLKQFNNRDSCAFNEIYELFCSELRHFASRLFYGTEIDVDDVIQDIFLTIWENSGRKFDSILGIKAYIYVSIKNKLKNHVKHNRHVSLYNKKMLDDDCFVTQVAESEMLSILSQAVDLLPDEYSKVFKLHADGWEVKDIADFLNKPESTVYKYKQRAIKILKGKLDKQLIIILLSL